MQDFIQTFHIDWRLMIAQMINFGLVFLALYFLAAKPLRKLIKDRTSEIETGLTDAKENAVLLEKTKKEHAEVLTSARLEAQKLFDEGKKEALAKKESMINDAKAEVNTIIENGKKSLEAEKVKMVGEAKNELASLAILAAEKIMQEKQVK
ncbi:MAG TPA: F0F1 ATP synthase subunit B [Candidatus Paceibacterota bacterium]|jgi:F-type H+-transporting ATPase subunit b|nr:F0F1 ATP synthase subunit B [Candidatus Paceibacterota bacterium]